MTKNIDNIIKWMTDIEDEYILAAMEWTGEILKIQNKKKKGSVFMYLGIGIGAAAIVVASLIGGLLRLNKKDTPINELVTLEEITEEEKGILGLKDNERLILCIEDTSVGSKNIIIDKNLNITDEIFGVDRYYIDYPSKEISINHGFIVNEDALIICGMDPFRGLYSLKSRDWVIDPEYILLMDIDFSFDNEKYYRAKRTYESDWIYFNDKGEIVTNIREERDDAGSAKEDYLYIDDNNGESIFDTIRNKKITAEEFYLKNGLTWNEGDKISLCGYHLDDKKLLIKLTAPGYPATDYYLCDNEWNVIRIYTNVLSIGMNYDKSLKGCYGLFEENGQYSIIDMYTDKRYAVAQEILDQGFDPYFKVIGEDWFIFSRFENDYRNIYSIINQNGHIVYNDRGELVQYILDERIYMNTERSYETGIRTTLQYYRLNKDEFEPLADNIPVENICYVSYDEIAVIYRDEKEIEDGFGSEDTMIFYNWEGNELGRIYGW